MSDDAQQVNEALHSLAGLADTRPTMGLLTGTGLEACVASLTVSETVDYRDIRHMPLPTVAGHPGRLVFGRIGDCPVAAFRGRLHLYEGYSPRQVTFPIRLLRALGASTVVLTNAAGGLNPAFSTGDIMIIGDHINLTGASPLTGPNNDGWGPRFPDMGHAYDGELASLARTAGAEAGACMQTGVYAGLAGPSLETPAEVRFLRAIGADAVGFSTVQEVIAAVHGGMAVLGISTITNVHRPEEPSPVGLEEVLAVAGAAAPHIDNILRRVAARLAQRPPR